MKKNIALIMTGAMVLSLAACSVTTEKTTSETTTPATEATTEVATEATTATDAPAEATTEEYYDDEAEIAVTEFGEIARAISEANSDTATDAANLMVAFATAYGNDMTEQSLETFISDYFTVFAENDQDLIAGVKEHYQEVVDAAYASDSSLETDVPFSQLVNALKNVLDQM